MRGLASGIPATADPSTVASGPTGSGDFGWDHDGSYGDWYTGHELGHTFGRFHAEFCGAGGGASYPFANGQLSNADGAFVGFDTGDAAQNLPMRALPGEIWHDVMTYCAFQWLSSFTYTNIRNRLTQEDALPAGMPGGSGARASRSARGAKAMSNTDLIHVVATVNLTHASGQLQHVTPQPAVASGAVLSREKEGPRRRSASGKPNLALRVYGSDDALLAEYRTELIPDACRDAGDDETGTVDASIPQNPAAVRLELVLDGNVLDTFSPGRPAKAVKDIRAASRAGKRAATRDGVGGPSDESINPVITWSDAAPAARTSRGTRAEGAAEPAGAVYSVQVSTDDGETWQTVGFGLRDPQVAIDHNLLGDAEKIKVRITSIDGFRSATVEKVFKASDLI